MEMSIDEYIKRMGDIRSNYDRWSVLGLTPNEAKAFDMSISTTRKYQKIEQIYSDYLKYMNPDNLADRMGEVIEDGKTD